SRISENNTCTFAGIGAVPGSAWLLRRGLSSSRTSDSSVTLQRAERWRPRQSVQDRTQLLEDGEELVDSLADNVPHVSGKTLPVFRGWYLRHVVSQRIDELF